MCSPCARQMNGEPTSTSPHTLVAPVPMAAHASDTTSAATTFALSNAEQR